MNFNPATAQADARALKAKFFAPQKRRFVARDYLWLATPTRELPPPPPKAGKPPSARLIVLNIAYKHGVGAEGIYSGKRGMRVDEARAEAICAVYVTTGWKLSKIANYFGRDRTTVLHHLQKGGLR